MAPFAAAQQAEENFLVFYPDNFLVARDQARFHSEGGAGK
jgi:hypothetical protein